jgi:2-phospho-L-lactate guanylyltransferase
MNAFDIVIPCKGLASGKSRLSDVLTPRERENLCRRLLSRTVGIAIAAAGRERVTVVSADPRVRGIAALLGASVLDDGGRGLNEALTLADTAIRDAAAPRGLMVLPIDLPLVTVDLLREAAARTQAVGIAPDTAGTGTNLLVLGPEVRGGFPFAFGPGSFRLHREAGLALGAPVTVLRHAHLAFDLDRPADLSALSALKIGDSRR